MSSLGHGNPQSYKLGDLYEEDLHIIRNLIGALYKVPGIETAAVQIMHSVVHELVQRYYQGADVD